MSVTMPPVPPDGSLRIRVDSLAGLAALEQPLPPPTLGDARTPPSGASRGKLTKLRTTAGAAWRPLLGLTIVLLAYRVSLLSLIELMRLDTPLAHIALVPFISLGIAYAVRNQSAGPAIHDRQLDWIVGLFLVSLALVASVILPARLSSQYWVWRIDLLTFPLFVAGTIALLFGVRTLWKYRLAVAFLFLAWPYPYSLVLERWLGRFTQTTIWALDIALARVSLANRVPGTDSLFQVSKNGFNVQMSVASACSGANGLVGFVLVAGAFLLLVQGSKPRKFAWLATGALLVWVLNLVRILIIFWSAGQWGEAVAIEGFHPYVGLVVFNLAVLIMVLLLRPFGLKMVGGVTPTPKQAPSPQRPKPHAALACVGLMALAVGVFNGQLTDYDRIADSLGSPRLTTFATSQETPPGWELHKTDTYDWSKRFFGQNSNWNRYQYQFAGTDASTLQANVPIIVDVIATPDRAALSAYGIEQCYTFHGYSITGRQSIDLGNGLIGGMLTWTSSETNLTWTTLYWHWPIKNGDHTEYERVTLVMNDQPTNTFVSPEIGTDSARQLQLDLNDVLRGTGSEEDRTRLISTRTFMVNFARTMVSMRSAAPIVTA